MNSSLTWNPVIPWLPLLLIGGFLLVVLLVFEWNRKQRFLWIRIACQAALVLSVLALLGRPALSIDQAARSVIILTKGFDTNHVDSVRRLNANAELYTTADADEFPGAQRLTSFYEITDLNAEEVWVIGAGLPSYALNDLPFNFTFLPSAMPDGISSISMPDNIIVDRPNTINGTFHSSSPASWTLKLIGPGGIEDSTVVDINSNDVPFALSFYPKVAGQLLYTVEVVDSEHVARAAYQLPIAVQPQRKLEVLFISDYPSFEQRYLKNFLASNGHRVAIRNRVSANQFHTEFSNRPSTPVDRLQSTLLDNADIMIIDQISFRSISEGEKSQVRRAIERGLGVLIIAGEKSKSNDLLSFQQLQGAQDTARFSLGVEGSFTLPVAAIKTSQDASQVHTATDGRTLAGCVCPGDSKIGFQLLRETYQIGLAGKTEAYAAIWTPLLERIARRTPDQFQIVMRTTFPVYSNEPIDFDVFSSQGDPVTGINGVDVPMIEDRVVDDVWHGRAWADGNRWHSLRTGSDSLFFYDLPETEWSEVRTARQIEANKNHRTQRTASFNQQARESDPLVVVLFLIFLVSSGFLWLAPKI